MILELKNKSKELESAKIDMEKIVGLYMRKFEELERMLFARCSRMKTRLWC